MSQLNWINIAFANDLAQLKERRIGAPPTAEIWEKYPQIKKPTCDALKSIPEIPEINERLKRYAMTSKDVAYILVRHHLIHEKYKGWPGRIRKKFLKYRSSKFGIKVRRQFSKAIESLDRRSMFFSPNQKSEWVVVKVSVQGFLDSIDRVRSFRGTRPLDSYMELCLTLRDVFCSRTKSKNKNPCEGHDLINEIVSMLKSSSYQPSNLKRDLKKIPIGSLQTGFY